MFIGHYGPSFVGKVAKPAIPLWVLFLSVQLVDIAWSILVLLGIKSSALSRGSLRQTRSIFITCHSLIACRARFSGQWAQRWSTELFGARRAAGIRNRGSRRILALDPRSGGAPP